MSPANAMDTWYLWKGGFDAVISVLVFWCAKPHTQYRCKTLWCLVTRCRRCKKFIVEPRPNLKFSLINSGKNSRGNPIRRWLKIETSKSDARKYRMKNLRCIDLRKRDDGWLQEIWRHCLWATIKAIRNCGN